MSLLSIITFLALATKHELLPFSAFIIPVGVKDQVELAHVLEALVERLDKDLNEIEASTLKATGSGGAGSLLSSHLLLNTHIHVLLFDHHHNRHTEGHRRRRRRVINSFPFANKHTNSRVLLRSSKQAH
jgi:hypothetical protein